MEVEARFTVPDRQVLLRLQKVVRLGPFTPGPASRRRVRDRYLDTAGRALYGAGYACRVRCQDERWMVTLKGLGEADSAIHQRFESQSDLPGDALGDPQTWPAGEVRDLTISLVGSDALEPMFTIEQTRHVRELCDGDRGVAELSLDEVLVQAKERQRAYSILEVELLPGGTMEDLQGLVTHLEETWGLAPERCSKFHLALALLDEEACEAEPTPGRLTDEERAQLTEIAKAAEEERHRERAELLLGWDRGAPVQSLTSQIGRSRSWGYFWIERFREQGMDAFAPSPALEEEGKEAPMVQEGGEWGTQPMPAGGTGDAQMSVAQMCARFHVDLAHARGVANHALALFDATASIHKLDASRRRLLETMAMLHNVGLDSDPDRHHIAGCDIVLEHPVAGLSSVEQRMLAAAIYLHRKRIKRKRLEADVVTSLPPSIHGDTMALAALLRVADGLDYTQGQQTVLDATHLTSAAVRLLVSGPTAEVDAARAQRKTDLWEMHFGVPLFVTTQSADALQRDAASGRAATAKDVPVAAGGDEMGADARSEAPSSPGVLADDRMSEAGRKVLRFHFLRMLAHEAGTRAGEDIEELHDMRVATRRMRSAFRVFAKYYKPRAIRPHVAGLRRTARVLGAVRDLDVLSAHAQAYLQTQPEEHAHDLDPLLEVWQAKRAEARAKMIAHLDRYGEFVEAFQLFLETPGAGARKMEGMPPPPVLVSAVVPRLIYARWARVQAFSPVLDGAPVAVLHALRIECKRLRYTLEFFREVLGTGAQEAIAEVVQLQDHLGALHDADVANGLLSEFLFRAPEDGGERVIAPGVVAYLAVQQRELQRLIDVFPERWRAFNRPEVRTWLAEGVAAL